MYLTLLLNSNLKNYFLYTLPTNLGSFFYSLAKFIDMIVTVCALAKNENLYINEWCRYYLDLGFDSIYIYDNNDSTTPYIKNFIDKDIVDRVTIININDKKEKGLQWKYYSHFYNLYKDRFDWCLFCDIDEFLVGVKNIKKFLSNDKFKNVEQIRIKWNLFGDDDIIERDVKEPVHSSFKYIIRDNKLSNQGKCIVRGNLSNILFKSCHYAFRIDRDGNRLELRSCLPSGAISKNDTYEIVSDYSRETIFLNHFMTKSLSEFINQKIGRGDAVFVDRKIDLEYYWRINKKTDEKIKWLEERGL